MEIEALCRVLLNGGSPDWVGWEGKWVSGITDPPDPPNHGMLGQPRAIAIMLLHR